MVAVQEVRDATDTAVGALLELINADQDAGEQYAVIESERFGSTTSKESCEFFLKEKKQPQKQHLHIFPQSRPPFIAGGNVAAEGDDT